MPEPINEEEPVEFPITGELDLHTFRPSDLGELIPAYLDAARAKGIREVRIIHGKGTGHRTHLAGPITRYCRLSFR